MLIRAQRHHPGHGRRSLTLLGKPMTDTIDVEGLERLARAATPGPWVSERIVDEWGLSVIASDESDMVSNPSRGQVCHVSVVAGASGDDAEKARSNAAFIAAANPATILALLATLRKQREALEQSTITLRMLKRNVETEIKCHGGVFRWEGVPEAIQVGIDQARQALSTQPEGGQTNV